MGGKTKSFRETCSYIPSVNRAPDNLNADDLAALPAPPEWVRDILTDESQHPAWVVQEAINACLSIVPHVRAAKNAKQAKYVPPLIQQCERQQKLNATRDVERRLRAMEKVRRKRVAGGEP